MNVNRTTVFLAIATFAILIGWLVLANNSPKGGAGWRPAVGFLDLNHASGQETQRAVEGDVGGGASGGAASPGDAAPAAVLERAVAGETSVYKLRFSRARDVEQVLREQFAGEANFALDGRRQALIVRAPAETQERIRALIEALDVAPGNDDLMNNGSSSHGLVVGQKSSRGSSAGRDQRRIEEALARLRDADNEEQKQAARTALRGLLSAIFAEDMQAREKQVQEIEDRLGKLRQQYRERETVKEQIIDLQLKVLENDAAGLGFPRASSTSGSPDDPLIHSGLPSRNVPTKRVDQFDPTPTERTLDEVKRANAAAVGELTKRGHFIESPDGRLYVYVNSNRPAGPSVLRVIDAATGKLVTTANFNILVGPLQFTDEGIATHEADGTLKLRVPLAKRAGPGGAVYEPNGVSDRRQLGERTNRATNVPSSESSEWVTPREMLAFKPDQPAIDYDQPAEDEADSCQVVLEAGSAWSLLSRDGVLLRRFEDTNRDGKVDSWRYYKAGREVHRDIDSDHDGRADGHEAAEPRGSDKSDHRPRD